MFSYFQRFGARVNTTSKSGANLLQRATTWRKPSGVRRKSSGTMQPCLELLEPRDLLAAASMLPQVTSVVVASTSWSPAFVQSLADKGLGQGGYQIPVGSSAQFQYLPWQNLNEIKVTFNESVSQSAIGLINMQGKVVTQQQTIYDRTTTTATLILSDPLAPGEYLLVLDGHSLGGFHDAAGNYLDGKWTDGSSVYPSGNGIAGTDFLFRFNVLPGDVNQDGIVNGQDLAKLSSNWAHHDPAVVDLNADLTIDSRDIAAIASAWLTRPQANELVTAISLDPLPNSIISDQSITLSAQLAATSYGSLLPGNGTVTFFSDGVALGSAPVMQGSAKLAGVALPVGQHTISASYQDPAGVFASSITAAIGPASTIETIAGGGVGDGLASVDTLMHNNRAIAVDGEGNIYIADARNNRIRRIDHTTGLITTVAGDGNAAYSGDNGPAALARLNRPNAITLDTLGNVYIADTGNNVVRKIENATGIITTVAGNGTGGFGGDNGPAVAAKLNFVWGLTVDADGNVFILDSLNRRIRKVDQATGIITTIAGNGTLGYAGDNELATQASINAFGLATNASGDIFIADGFLADGAGVRKIDHNTGIITRVVGQGSSVTPDATFVGAQALAFDAAGNLLISDEYGRQIHKVDLAAGTMTVIAGGGTAAGDNVAASDAQLSYLYSIAVGPAGDLYFVQSGFTGPAYALPSTSPNYLRKINQVTNQITTIAGLSYSGDGDLATDAELNAPQGIAVDSAGNLFIADTTDNVIRKVDPATGVITTIVGTGAAGYTGDNGPAAEATLQSPTAIAVDAAGNLYIVDSLNLALRKVDHGTGEITTIATLLHESQFVAVSTAGDVFFPSQNSIFKIDHTSGVITKVAADGSQSNDGSWLREIDHATGARIPVASYVGASFAFGPDGHVYVADGYSILEIDPATGIATTIASAPDGTFNDFPLGDGGPAIQASLSARSVAVDAAGNLYIADPDHDRIRVIRRGVVINVVAPQPASSQPTERDEQTAVAAALFHAPTSQYALSADMIATLARMPTTGAQSTSAAGTFGTSAIDDDLLSIIASARKSGDLQ